MKCQLIGFQRSEGVDRSTNELYKFVKLFFVRKPSLSENGVEGNVAFCCSVYNDNIKDLPELVLDAPYNVNCRQYKGKYYLDDMTALK